VDKVVRKVILNIIGSMAVLPNRYLVKLDSNNDYFKTYLPHLGALRVTVEKATNTSIPKEHGARGFLNKIIKDVPDCYCKVRVGAGEWRTSIKKNDYHPEWNETHDFLVEDDDQRIFVEIFDDDFGSDDDIGLGSITVKELLLAGGTQELDLVHKGTPTDAKVIISAKFYHLVDDASLITSAEGDYEGPIVGLATVLIAGALGLQGQRDELNPSVKVEWGATSFCTATKSYSPGMDIFNPSFDQAFQIPLTADVLANPGNFKIALLNRELETGSVEIPFEDVLQAPGLVKEESFDMGSGAVVRASISLRGLQLAR
jgi:Ca2+-dependent lipid-binding protein